MVGLGRLVRGWLVGDQGAWMTGTETVMFRHPVRLVVGKIHGAPTRRLKQCRSDSLPLPGRAPCRRHCPEMEYLLPHRCQPHPARALDPLLGCDGGCEGPNGWFHCFSVMTARQQVAASRRTRPDGCGWGRAARLGASSAFGGRLAGPRLAHRHVRKHTIAVVVQH